MTDRSKSPLLLCGLVLVSASLAPSAAAEAVERPFILWTKEEAAAIRKRIETDPEAKLQYEKMMKDRGNSTFKNLFNYLVMGDENAGERERQYLLHFIGKHPKDFYTRIGGGRHFDNYLDVLRYDVLYDELSPEQRKGLEDTFRAFIRHHCHEDKFTYTRTSWLPNMQWPRPMAAHIMAVGLGDEKLIKEIIHSLGGWKWYMDEYVADGCFYMEEFGKHYSMIGEMLLFCRGLERLGLDEWGYGYVGKGGATMRKYVESIPMAGFPRVEVGSDRPHYPKVTMGDAKGGPNGFPPGPFLHSIVTGFLADGVTGGNRCWIACNMNGRDHKNTKVPKMMEPLWFEMGHAKWPDAGFGYFLAQMRAPDEDKYYPTLYFGLEPIDPEKVAAPPAPSYVAKERGFVMLRAEEGPAYWESPSPAVAFQLAMYYVHYVHDCFSLLGFYAHNRPIYVNRGIAAGYAGGDPWTDSVRGHCGVVVDNKQARPVDNGIHGARNTAVRHAFDEHVKFAAARARGIYEGVGQERALFLTGEYLLDIFHLKSDEPRTYDWQVHALGAAQPGTGPYGPGDPKAWKPADELDGGKLYDRERKAFADRLNRFGPAYDLKQVRKMEPAEKTWSLTVLQTCRTPEPEESPLGKAWYDKKVGVCVSMLGEAGTTVYHGKTPVSVSAEWSEPEVGGVTLLVRRRTPRTAFVALHEPLEGGKHKIREFRRIAETDTGVAVAIGGAPGSSVNDRVMVALGDEACSKLQTLCGDGESFTFADRAYVRVGRDKVEVSGDLRAMKVRARGRPKLVVNGQETPATVSGGYLSYEAAQ